MTEAMTPEPNQDPIPASAAIVPVSGGNLELSASTPDEMVQCHGAMIEWSHRKLALVRNEAKELRDAYEYAKKMKWRNDTLKRHADLADKRVVFYEKFKAALEAGYCVVPNFPVTLFAIRTDKKKPKADYAYYRNLYQHNYEQEPKLLPEGKGEYKNPQPVVLQGQGKDFLQQDGTKIHKREEWADRWDDMEFPANMARLHVMHAATRAMALKIFDEIGMLPEDHRRNPDPMIIGRIIKPASAKYLRSTVSFLLAWHVCTNDL